MTALGETVLIVEDNTDLRGMFRTALNLAGFNTLEAGDGLGALKLIDQVTPSAIVLDLGLPQVSGYEVLQELAAQAHTRHIPVVVATAQPNIEPTGGIVCLLRKPVSPDRLVETVRRCIQMRARAADL